MLTINTRHTSHVGTIELLAVRILRAMNELDITTKQGGYLSIFPKDCIQVPVIVLGIGVIPDKKKEKYFNFSLEKAQRALKHNNHNSSFMTRNPELNQWAGAVVANNYAYSFSGLSEAQDEALALLLAYDTERFDEIQSFSTMYRKETCREVLPEAVISKLRNSHDTQVSETATFLYWKWYK